jgi:hypothetical protein
MSSNYFAAGNPPTFGPSIFKYGHVFQRGELPIYISDLSGNPVSPAIVTYTIFRYEAGNPNPIQVGAADRTPVNAGIGEYYVSGVAGEFGQPGEWFVRWRYQADIDSPVTEDYYPFEVLDTSQLASSCGKTGKFGWD